MSDFPLAYHITWGTHGARLHGSDKPHVDRLHNVYGTPFPEADAAREALVRAYMTNPEVTLTLAQRKTANTAIAELCTRFEWCLHAIA